MEFARVGPDPQAEAIKQQLAEVVLWNEHMSPRSRQRAVGPSELGEKCERRLAYRLAGADTINRPDPWPAVVGTAIHAWLEGAVKRYQRHAGTQEWMTEVRVHPDDLVVGSSDAYYIPTCTVVDYKTTNSETIKKLRKGEPPSSSYITQINLYGLGHERAGRQVKSVSLVYYPRSGWLNDAFVWHAPYDRSIAEAALARMYQLGFRLIDLDIQQHPERFEQIPASPGDSCVWCPMFVRESDPSITASARGCPGR